MGNIYSINIYKLQDKYHFSKKTFKLLCNLSPKETADLANDLAHFKRTSNINCTRYSFIKVWLARLIIDREIKKKNLILRLENLF
jgi:hypothetical protein